MLFSCYFSVLHPEGHNPVNFGTGVNKASVFCQCYDFFHRFYCHFNSSLQNNFFTLRRTKVIAKPTAPLLRSSRIRPIRNFAHMLRYSCRYIRQIDAVLCAGTWQPLHVSLFYAKKLPSPRYTARDESFKNLPRFHPRWLMPTHQPSLVTLLQSALLCFALLPHTSRQLSANAPQILLFFIAVMINLWFIITLFSFSVKAKNCT